MSYSQFPANEETASLGRASTKLELVPDPKKPHDAENPSPSAENSSQSSSQNSPDPLESSQNPLLDKNNDKNNGKNNGKNNDKNNEKITEKDPKNEPKNGQKNGQKSDSETDAKTDTEKGKSAENAAKNAMAVKVIHEGRQTVVPGLQPSWTVQRLFEEALQLCKSDEAKNCSAAEWVGFFIFLGKKLKSDETLAQSGVVDGVSVHMTARKVERPAGETSTAQQQQQQTISTLYPDIENALAQLATKKETSEDDSQDGELLGCGSYSDFVMGFALGFFFGFVMILWTWNPQSPRLMKLGILLGILLGLAISYVEEASKLRDSGGDPGDVLPARLVADKTRAP